MRPQEPLRRLLRVPVAGVTIGLVALAGAAFLSDRVPRLLGLARDRIDTPGWFPWTLDDTALHVIIWLGITLLASVAVRTLPARLAAGLAVLAAATVIEYLQLRYTATRAFGYGDLVANTRGVYLGLLGGIIVGGVADALESRRAEGRDRLADTA